MKVNIYEQGKLQGSINWDWATKKFSLSPDNTYLRSILDNPIYVPIGGELTKVEAKTDPVLFMYNLYREYHSGQGIRADQVEDPDTDEDTQF